MAKKKDVVPVFVDNVEALEAKMQDFLCGSSCSEQNAYSTCKAGS